MINEAKAPPVLCGHPRAEIADGSGGCAASEEGAQQPVPSGSRRCCLGEDRHHPSGRDCDFSF